MRLNSPGPAGDVTDRTNRQADRQTETNRQVDRQADRPTGRQEDR